MKFLNANNILYRHQYGFRAKHSTIHPVLHLLNHCAEANNITPRPFVSLFLCCTVIGGVFDLVLIFISINLLADSSSLSLGHFYALCYSLCLGVVGRQSILDYAAPLISTSVIISYNKLPVSIVNVHNVLWI